MCQYWMVWSAKKAMRGKGKKDKGDAKEKEEVDATSSDGQEWHGNREGKLRGGYGDESDEEVFDLSAQQYDEDEEVMSFLVVSF